MVGKAAEMIRKGPWTEEEDYQLNLYVKLFGERRWDFIAKVSGLKVGGRRVLGLKRTGKSCRLRWVNYLHPDLKRGKMTPHEQRLVLQLHSKWGNRWSKIAQNLPGRTDNDIKNYYRSHMRKTTQERKKLEVSLPSSSSSTSSSSNRIIKTNFYGIDNLDVVATTEKLNLVATQSCKNMNRTISRCIELKDSQDKDDTKLYSMDEIWKDIELSQENYNISSQTMASPIWNCCPDSLWPTDEEANNLFLPMSHQFHSFSQDM